MRRFALAALVLALIAYSTTAYGLFEIKNPLSTVWKMSEIAVGTIETTRDNGRIFTVKLTSVPKEAPAKPAVPGDASESPATSPGGPTPRDFAAGDVVAIQIIKPEDLSPRIAKDQPVVIVRSGIKDIIINVADDWYLARPGNTPRIFNVVGLPKDFRGTFPGHTADLVQVLDQYKAGKQPLLDVVPARFLGTQVKLGAVAAVRNVVAISAGIDDKQHVLLYIETAEGAAVYQLNEGTLKKLDNAVTTQKERLAKHALKRSETDKNPPLEKAVTIAMGSFGADGGDGALAVLGDKLVRVSDWEKPTEKMDDELGLLGSTLKEHLTEWKAGITDAVISRCDVNGDGRDDAVIVSSKGALVLLNRGFGVFLVAKAEGDAFKGALAATADPVSGGLLVLRKTDDGSTELWRVSTPNP